MSGHSKWHNIAQKKGKADAARANVFTKIGREIAIAVKNGGADPASNSELRNVIAKAKANNMPNDNINRSIKKASGELGSINYEENTYEGYGVGGVACIVETLTDNKNRTAGVSYMFHKKGQIVVAKCDIDEDSLMMEAMEAGAEDINSDDDEVFIVYTAPDAFSDVRDAFESAGMKMVASEITMIADVTAKPDEHQQETLLKMIDLLEDNDDVQNVYHNAEITILDDEED